jgi:hypothetical protein
VWVQQFIQARSESLTDDGFVYSCQGNSRCRDKCKKKCLPLFVPRNKRAPANGTAETQREGCCESGYAHAEQKYVKCANGQFCARCRPRKKNAFRMKRSTSWWCGPSFYSFLFRGSVRPMSMSALLYICSTQRCFRQQPSGVAKTAQKRNFKHYCSHFRG